MGFGYKKIAITGGAGFVGSNLAVKLKEHYPEIEITALDNLRRRGSELILGRIRDYGIKFKHADVRNREDLEGVFCDLVIECSAEPSAQAGIYGGIDYLVNTNLMGAVNCLELARRERADFLFLSTSRVYPFDGINNMAFKETGSRFELDTDRKALGVSSEGIGENFPLDGVRTFYGATKLAAECLIKEYAHFKGVRSIINRCGLITGPWQMGKVDQGVVVFWVVSHMLGKPLKYIGWHGKQVRDFINIDDLFDIINLQLNNFAENSGEVFNIGGGKDFSFSLLELTEVCVKLTGKKVPVLEDDEIRQGDVRWYLSDATKARSEFGWSPKKNLEETVSEILAWAQKHKHFLGFLV